VDKLLWLLLTFRLLRLAAPCLLGFVGAFVVIGYVHPAVPPGWLFLLFVFVAACFIGELRSIFRSGDRADRRHDHHHGDQT
jgi:hypothetical protein